MTTRLAQRSPLPRPDTDTMTSMNPVTSTADPHAHQCGSPEDALVMDLLHEHVPIALLCDLTAPEGPPSAQILAEEGLPDSTWWER